MKLKKYSAALLCASLVFGPCNNNDDKSTTDPTGSETGDDTIVAGPPVENNPANTSYSPAFQGQTRIGSVVTATPIQSTILTSSLNAPWGLASLPDGRFLVTEKSVTMRIITASGSIGSPLGGLPTVNSSGQGGLLDLCLDPNFSGNRMVYWGFAETVAGGTVLAITKGRFSDDDSSIENATVIYRAYPAISGGLQYGSRLIFDATGNLIISTGERTNVATLVLAQSVTAAIGKILRITTEGLLAPGNPSFSQSGALPELYSMGHRNPQGLAFNPITGE